MQGKGRTSLNTLRQKQFCSIRECKVASVTKKELVREREIIKKLDHKYKEKPCVCVCARVCVCFGVLICLFVFYFFWRRGG